MYLDASDAGMAFVYVQNPTGAVLAGDRLSLDFELDCETRVHVSTPSATKLHSMPVESAEQRAHFRLAKNAYLESFSDALIPHAMADYRQTTVVDLAGDAAFIGCDVVASGRVASGERFAYRRLGLQTLVRVDGRSIHADELDLAPGRRSPMAAGIMGGYDYLVTVLGVAPGITDHEQLGNELHQELCALGVGRVGAGALPSGLGVLVRALAPDRVAAYRLATAAWTSLRRSFRGLDPLHRRM
jgi:urease accessory protein